jgi:putative NADH-flavin reductase
MKITILGANGRTGTELVKQALAAGHSVHGIVRENNGLEENPNLTIFVGDATDPNVVTLASKGSDVIISTLGAMTNRSTVMTDSVKAVIAASVITGLKRFILMSSFAVEENRLKSGLKLVAGMMHGIISDKTNSEKLVRNSDLDWTIVYATRLTSQSKGSGLRIVSEGEKIGINNKIARADVAAWILKEAEENVHVKADVTISQ